MSTVVVRAVSNAFGVDFAPRQLQAMWVGLGLLLMLSAAAKDVARLVFVLNPHSLVMGRGIGATQVHFSEIESIVLGLPPHMPWWMRFMSRFMGFHPSVRTARDNLQILRANTACLRLPGFNRIRLR